MESTRFVCLCIVSAEDVRKYNEQILSYDCRYYYLCLFIGKGRITPKRIDKDLFRWKGPEKMYASTIVKISRKEGLSCL